MEFNYTRFDERMQKLWNSKRAEEFAKFMGEQIAQIYIEENGRQNTERSAAWRFAHRWMTGSEISLPMMMTFGRYVHKHFQNLTEAKEE